MILSTNKVYLYTYQNLLFLYVAGKLNFIASFFVWLEFERLRVNRDYTISGGLLWSAFPSLVRLRLVLT